MLLWTLLFGCGVTVAPTIDLEPVVAAPEAAEAAPVSPFVEEELAVDAAIGPVMDVAPHGEGWVVLGRDGRQFLDAELAPGEVLPWVRIFDGPARLVDLDGDGVVEVVGGGAVVCCWDLDGQGRWELSLPEPAGDYVFLDDGLLVTSASSGKAWRLDDDGHVLGRWTGETVRMDVVGLPTRPLTFAAAEERALVMLDEQGTETARVPLEPGWETRELMLGVARDDGAPVLVHRIHYGLKHEVVVWELDGTQRSRGAVRTMQDGLTMHVLSGSYEVALWWTRLYRPVASVHRDGTLSQSEWVDTPGVPETLYVPMPRLAGHGSHAFGMFGTRLMHWEQR